MLDNITKCILKRKEKEKGETLVIRESSKRNSGSKQYIRDDEDKNHENKQEDCNDTEISNSCRQFVKDNEANLDC